MVMRDLDEVDRQLIAALRVDGRAPLSSLAAQLGLTRVTVKKRLDRLMEDGIVLGFTARVHDGIPGDDVRAVSLIEVTGQSTQKVIGELRGFPQIEALYSTNGGWDLVAEIRTRTLVEFDRLLIEIRSIDGIINSQTNLLLSSVLR
jgi:DNA-binding Lrp family transcriptional regulator